MVLGRRIANNMLLSIFLSLSLTKCLIVDLKASVPQGSKACLPSQKSEGVVYHRALLPHEAYGAPQAKLKELKRLHAEERERE